MPSAFTVPELRTCTRSSIFECMYDLTYNTYDFYILD